MGWLALVQWIVIYEFVNIGYDEYCYVINLFFKLYSYIQFTYCLHIYYIISSYKIKN